MELTASKVISTILKHDRKVTSYKIVLVRAINDVVLSFPDVITFQKDIAVPLRLLAEYWNVILLFKLSKALLTGKWIRQWV